MEGKIPLQSKDFQARKPPVLEQQKKGAIKLWVTAWCAFCLYWAMSKHTALNPFLRQSWEGTYPPPLPGWGWLCCKVVHLSRFSSLDMCVSLVSNINRDRPPSSCYSCIFCHWFTFIIGEERSQKACCEARARLVPWAKMATVLTIAHVSRHKSSLGLKFSWNSANFIRFARLWTVPSQGEGLQIGLQGKDSGGLSSQAEGLRHSDN